jgi:hypothetical protein
MFGIVVNNNEATASRNSQSRSGPQHVNRRGENQSQRQRQQQPPRSQRTEGSLGTGLVLHDDDVGGSLSSSTSAESFAARSATNPSASGAFPALAPPSAKIEKVAWVKSSKPSPVFAPAGPAIRGGGLSGVRPVAESGIAQRNMRLQLALGLNSGSGAAAASADSSANGAAQQQQAEQFATVWPTELRKWAQNERGEVIKLERKVAELLADPRGTSTTIKAMVRKSLAVMTLRYFSCAYLPDICMMDLCQTSFVCRLMCPRIRCFILARPPQPRAMRRLTYMWAEFYAINGRSDDDGRIG